MPTNPYSDNLNIALDVIVVIFLFRILLRRLWHPKRQILRQEAWTCDMTCTIIERHTLAVIGVYYASWITLLGNLSFDDEFDKLYNFYDDLDRRNLTGKEQLNYMSKSPQSYSLISWTPLAQQSTICTQYQLWQVFSLLYSKYPYFCHGHFNILDSVLSALQFHPTLGILTNTFISSTKRLGSFFFVFLLDGLALATSGCLLFVLFNIMVAVIIAAHQEVVEGNVKYVIFIDKVASIHPRRAFLGDSTTATRHRANNALSVDQIAKDLQITQIQAEKLIAKLKLYASTSPNWSASTDQVSAHSQQFNKRSLDFLLQRMNDLERKMDQQRDS
ncbi:hypothetical protein THRCLA_07365, partial [Thraustotheca clavata]